MSNRDRDGITAGDGFYSPLWEEHPPQNRKSIVTSILLRTLIESKSTGHELMYFCVSETWHYCRYRHQDSARNFWVWPRFLLQRRSLYPGKEGTEEAGKCVLNIYHTSGFQILEAVQEKK